PAVLVISVSLSSFFGVIGYLFNISFFAENIEEGQFKRSLGGSTDPNNYALMIAFTLPFIKALVDKAKTPAQKTLYMGLLAINVLAVIFSFSRGGALIAAGLLFMMFVKHLRKQNVLLGVVQVFALILVIVVMMAVLPEKYTDHFKNILNPQADASIDRRSTYLIVGLESFYKYPILGTGLGTFRDIYAESYYARKFEKEGYTNRRFAHNTYLEYLVGTGLIGTLIFAAIIALAARNYIAARKNFLKQGDQEGVTQIETYILSFLILLVYLFIYSEPFHKYLLLSIGLSQVAYRLSLPGKK
ncbi:MAG: O-antigen ligase family protein, partial [Nitrospirae bacterium]|nr:O-antigen ligase family protein [Nitrospirota bacterium]